MFRSFATLPLIDNFDTLIVRLSIGGPEEATISKLFYLVCVLLLSMNHGREKKSYG
jgi:hypothetical protein